MRPSRGVTLVELMVVLALLAIMAGVVSLTWRPGSWQFQGGGPNGITALRQRAAASGRAVGDTVTIDGRLSRVIALPDGRVIGAAALGVDPLTGKPNAPR